MNSSRCWGPSWRKLKSRWISTNSIESTWFRAEKISVPTRKRIRCLYLKIWHLMKPIKTIRMSKISLKFIDIVIDFWQLPSHVEPTTKIQQIHLTRNIRDKHPWISILLLGTMTSKKHQNSQLSPTSSITPSKNDITIWIAMLSSLLVWENSWKEKKIRVTMWWISRVVFRSSRITRSIWMPIWHILWNLSQHSRCSAVPICHKDHIELFNYLKSVKTKWLWFSTWTKLWFIPKSCMKNWPQMRLDGEKLWRLSLRMGSIGSILGSDLMLLKFCSGWVNHFKSEFWQRGRNIMPTSYSMSLTLKASFFLSDYSDLTVLRCTHVCHTSRIFEF